MIWEDIGYHFESIDVGYFNEDFPAPQFYMDIDHTEVGKSMGFFYDLNGTRFGILRLDYGRHHRALDCTGDGLDEIVIGNALSIMNGKGELLAKLEFTHQSITDVILNNNKKSYVHMGILDITKNGIGDIVLHSGDTICIYFNLSNKKNPMQRFDDVNFTFY